MGVSIIGNTYTYVYNTETKKLSTTDGSQNDFVKYFNGDIKGSESSTLNNIDKQRKSGFENVLSLLAQSDVFANSLGDDTTFEISSKNIDGDTIEYSINGKTYLTCNIAPALTYSEYKEIADIWRSGNKYACTNNNGFPYPDSVYNKVLKRYEDWLYQSISDEKSSREVLQGKIEEMQENIEAGDVENDPVIKIGASEFTEKEWDRFLENYDELQEDIREAMRVEHEKRLKESQEEEKIQKEILEEIKEKERIQREEVLEKFLNDEIDMDEFMIDLGLMNI